MTPMILRICEKGIKITNWCVFCSFKQLWVAENLQLWVFHSALNFFMNTLSCEVEIARINGEPLKEKYLRKITNAEENEISSHTLVYLRVQQLLFPKLFRKKAWKNIQEVAMKQWKAMEKTQAAGLLPSSSLWGGKTCGEQHYKRGHGFGHCSIWPL